MLINEAGLIRAIKRAYRNTGYVVMNTGDAVAIYTDNWFILVNRALLPCKVLATIVEHMGVIPERGMPTSIIKDEDPQLVMRETAADDMDHWRSSNRRIKSCPYRLHCTDSKFFGSSNYLCQIYRLFFEVASPLFLLLSMPTFIIRRT